MILLEDFVTFHQCPAGLAAGLLGGFQVWTQCDQGVGIKESLALPSAADVFQAIMLLTATFS